MAGSDAESSKHRTQEPRVAAGSPRPAAHARENPACGRTRRQRRVPPARERMLCATL